MRLIRSFFGGFAILAATMFMVMPASASVEHQLDIYALGVEVPDFAVPDFSIAEVAPAVLPDTPAVAVKRSPATAVLGPIYSLSLETYGQSLPRYHMRC